MALTIVPTLSQQRYGQEEHQIFDFLAHNTRLPGGNPLMIYRCGGGGVGGDYRSVWDSVNGDEVYFMNYLNTVAPNSTPFDILSVQTTQRNLNGGPSIRGFKTSILESIPEFQVAIAELKRQGVIGFGPSNQYKIDPRKIILFGSSWGATLAILSQLHPPYVGASGQRTSAVNQYLGGNYTSQVRGVINHIGQIDCRRIGATEQMNFAIMYGWFCTSQTDAGAEYIALPARVKDAASIRAFIQNGDTQFYRPIFNLYQENIGTHFHPYTQAHDSQQYTDLNADLAAAQLSHSGRLYASGDMNSQTNPSQSASLYSYMHTWMATQISTTATIQPLPIV